ncbi:MAG: DinB family protein [Acidobacteriaceae bacterium]|nr:DinB family protein [Acidobacteriaceae bacterium]
MKKLPFVPFLALALSAFGQQAPKTPPTLKGILLDQLRTTHNVKEWFVPVNVAIAGLTPEQANWKDKSGNHSVMELTTHLAFWNERSLIKFKGGEPSKFSGDNEESFRSTLTWDAAVQKLDQVLTDWEKAIEAADDAKLQKWYSTIAHISAHNAYHTGEIIYVRREQGSWNPANGVH